MSIILSPEQTLFKTAMTDQRVAKEFFERHLTQDIKPLVDLNCLTVCEKTFIHEELKQDQIDMLYKTKIENDEGYLYVVYTNQSNPLMAFHILEYNVAFWKEYLKQNKSEKLPLIFNTVFYNGDKKYDTSPNFEDLFA